LAGVKGPGRGKKNRPIDTENQKINTWAIQKTMASQTKKKVQNKTKGGGGTGESGYKPFLGLKNLPTSSCGGGGESHSIKRTNKIGKNVGSGKSKEV